MEVKTCAWCKTRPGSLRMLQTCGLNILVDNSDITCIAHYLCDSCWSAFHLMDAPSKDEVRQSLAKDGSWVRLSEAS